MRPLEGQRAIVTGAGQGIGRAIAVAVAGAGADPVLVDLPRHEGLEVTRRAVQEAGGTAVVHEHDLSRCEELAALVDGIWERHGPLDLLVNNAGISHLERFNEITVARWRRVMTVNADAAFFLAQRVAERMIDAGRAGSIVNISSKNGLVAEAGLAHYNASKAAVESITQSLAIELGEFGIRVNSVAPGIVDTGMADDFDLDWESFWPYYAEHIPLRGRPGTPEECAAAVVFLASPAAGYVTGQRLVVDGGVLASQVPRTRFMPPYRSSLRTDR